MLLKKLVKVFILQENINYLLICEFQVFVITFLDEATLICSPEVNKQGTISGFTQSTTGNRRKSENSGEGPEKSAKQLTFLE